MKIAVLPFNAAEGTKPALGRQFAAFASEQIRVHANVDVNAVSFLTQIPDDEGATRMAFVNVADVLLEYDQIKEIFEQAEVDLVMDGLVKRTEDGFELTTRFHKKDVDEAVLHTTESFPDAEIFTKLHTLVKQLAAYAGAALPEFLAGETMEFGTDNAEAFLKFLEGYDALNYIQQSNGAVAREFSPEPAMGLLLESVEADPDFEGPYQVLIQLCRACAHYRIGTFESAEQSLTKLSELVPGDFGAFFGLGEIYQAVGAHAKAADFYEKAVAIEPNDGALYTRLGIAQMQSGMPVNAERNFRKALTMEGDDKPTTEFLATVLAQTGRAHEVPNLWKELIDLNNQNGIAHTRYAISLFETGREAEGERAFELALEVLEDNSMVKRAYAPLLTRRKDLDRAMDFYEDYLENNPGDAQAMLEYAETLKAADREFEVPRVLQEVLALNPDLNTRANVTAWLIEIEQPKRAESVENARMKMESGDFDGAVRDLKPLRNWLADYWKLWALLSAAYNRLEQYPEAEEAARRLLGMFPGCEPAFGELVNALAGQGRAEEGFQLMQFAAQNNPNSLGIHINLGLAAKRAGHSDEARAIAKSIREALGPNPDLEPVLTEMES